MSFFKKLKNSRGSFQKCIKNIILMMVCKAHTLKKIINATLLFLMSWTQRSKTFLCTQKAYFSQILFTNLSKSVLVSTSPWPRWFIIHDPWNEHSIHGQQLWWTFLQSVCQLHAPSKLATSVVLCCVIKLHILEWPFIVSSIRHTCAIIMLSNQYLDMPHLWGGWIISAKEKCSLTQI